MKHRLSSRLREIQEQLELEAYAEQQRDFHSYERPQRRPECVIESELLCDPGAWERERAYLSDMGDEIFERLRRLR